MDNNAHSHLEANGIVTAHRIGTRIVTGAKTPTRKQRPLKPGDERTTPKAFCDLVMEYRGGKPFGLDPCWNKYSHMPARTKLSRRDDSLRARYRWHRYRSIWLQPAYSDPAVFVDKLCRAWLDRNTAPTQYLALLCLDPTTRWFGQIAECGPAVLLRHRLPFELAGKRDNSARFSSVLFELGGTDDNRFKSFWRNYGYILDDGGEGWD